jgi:hypothetical protein
MVGHPALPKLLGVDSCGNRVSEDDPYYGYNSDKMQHLIATSKSDDTLEEQYKAVGGPNGLFTDIQRFESQFYVLIVARRRVTFLFCSVLRRLHSHLLLPSQARDGWNNNLPTPGPGFLAIKIPARETTTPGEEVEALTTSSSTGVESSTITCHSNFLGKS